MRQETIMRRGLMIAALQVCLAPKPAAADGFITPFYGFNFGGDSGNCASLTNCNEKRANFGVALGSMGSAVGVEEDISYAKNFFGDTPGADNSVFSAMTNLIIGVGKGPFQPYVVGGFGLIRPHVSRLSLSADTNTLGYDVGGGLGLFFTAHVG